MEVQIAILENAASSVASLAAHVAGVRAAVPPDAGRVRDQLTMCEEDLLSAADALQKALWAVGSTYEPVPAGQVTPNPVLLIPVADQRVQRPRPVSRQQGRVAAGQEVLFALPETA